MNLLSKQTDICVIDGICYEKGFVNPAQKNLACRPDYSTDSWTALRGRICNILQLYEPKLIQWHYYQVVKS